MAKRKREAHVQAEGQTKAIDPQVVRHQKLHKVKSKESEGAGTGAATAAKEHATKSKATEGVEKVKVHTLDGETTTIQIVTGSYERVLHGFTATIPRTLVTQPEEEDPSKEKEQPNIAFSDTFLFNAHASAIRCLALSPYIDNPDGNGKVLLATGSTDERINLYQISTRPPPLSNDKPKLPTLHGTSITENRRNKELGSLLHHDSSVTCLFFPSRGKLMSASEDSQIAITRTRDWVPLSTIKAPIPVPQGRPSGDTAAPGEVPSGINDFSVHPSMKLMVSVSKGEKCMRLWNLLTGKKAGVLTFSREILTAIGEGRFGTGEGRKVEWDTDGEEFAVSFERGVVVFGIDCIPTATIVPSPRTKIHQMRYLPNSSRILTLSTEDGRILFYDTKTPVSAPASTSTSKNDSVALPCAFIAQVGGPGAGIIGRVKDFEIIPYSSSSNGTTKFKYLIVAASSDGSVRLWSLDESELHAEPDDASSAAGNAGKSFTTKEVGKLVGTYSTGTRITCVKAFVMTGKPVEEEDGVETRNGKDEASGSSSEEDSD
ncbi:WD40-repeat-containing domain protein [Dendryphion nanum]|uniref:WD40-repeat-containing domain protein n=1 Tax=Dendryphion nanum TaxID=256645 RepID=A0A9P9E7G6_9PLEO|nr:WD40-repeat-containing domain protein [Dendryphion nanum]